ncbi:unnamed protein product [Diamesa hyperborea]
MLILIILCVMSSVFGQFGGERSRHNSLNMKRDTNLDLKLVHVLFRHGARTPADTYPLDPYVNETFAPYGWGQLTNNGRKQMFDVGSYLLKQYSGFLGKTFQPNEVYAQSTGVTRTKMSLQLVLAGLFPPANTPLEWNKNLNWLPIPYNYEELDKDSLLLVRTSCPRYHEEFVRIFNETKIKDEMEANSKLFVELSKITGLKIETPDDIQSLFSTLKAEEEYGIKLPSWTKQYYPDKLVPLTDKSYIYNSYNAELKKLKGGVFVKKAIKDWQEKIAQKLKTKIFLYAGHDSTITNILSAFNVWEQQFPDYGITAMLELSQHKKTNEYGIEIFLRNSTSKPPYQLTIPGCTAFCPLNVLITILDDQIPKDQKAECISSDVNFTEPPLTGP